MTDFEARIATLLNEHVDSELGQKRSVPPLATQNSGPVASRSRSLASMGRASWRPPALLPPSSRSVLAVRSSI